MTMFEQINEQLPLKVAHASWTSDVLTLSGSGWALTCAGAWRLRSSARVLIGCFDDRGTKEAVEGLVGRSIVRAEPQTSDFPVDLRIILNDGELLEVFASDTYEPWTWELPSPPIWVAAPGDEAWVREVAGKR